MNRRNLIKSVAFGAISLPLLSKGEELDDVKVSIESNEVLLQKLKLDLIDGKRVDIDCYGDSVMWGSNPLDLSKQTKNPAPETLGRVLNLFYPDQVTVNNLGAPGTTLKDLFNSGNAGSLELNKRMQNNSRVIYLNYGINDMMHGEDLNTYVEFLKKIVNLANSNGKAVVFVTPNIMTPYGFGNFSFSSKIPVFAQAMISAGKRLGVKVIDQYNNTKKDTESHALKSIIIDGAHMSDVNYKQMGFNLSSALLSASDLSQNALLQFCGISIGGSSDAKISNLDSFVRLSYKPKKGNSLSFAFSGDGTFELDISSSYFDGLKITLNDIEIEGVGNKNKKYKIVTYKNELLRHGLRVVTIYSKFPYEILSFKKNR